MAYYRGESLADRMKAAPIPSREVFQICFSIAQGLSFAHRNGIIHRDIKPGNIVITEEGHIKIVDFGLAKLAAESSRLTKTETTVGTVRYMSPEQTTDKEVDHRTDIWSLGVILYELATGQTPFRGEIDAAIFYSILHDDPKPVNEFNPHIPVGCARIIMRCLEKDADKRYQSVDELLNDMGALAKEMGWGSSIAGLTVPAIGPRSRTGAGHRLRIAGVIITAVVVLASAAAWLLTRESSVYTTDIRLAVMPLVNKTHPDNNLYVAGLTEVAYDMLDYASRRHESMWVVPNRLVRYAKLGSHSDAREAFGVNRIVTGDVQRYRNGQLLLLELRNAETLKSTRSVSIYFDFNAPSALSDSLPRVIAQLIELDSGYPDMLAGLIPSKTSAVKPYLEGLGAMQGGDAGTAVTFLEMMYSESPDFATGGSALGWACWIKHQKTGEEALLGRAITHLKASVESEPEFWLPCYYLGEIYRKTGKSDSAIIWYDAVIKKDPGNPLACRRLSYIYRDQKRYGESESILQAAIDRRTDYFESHRFLAKYYYDADMAEEAIRKFNETLALAPKDAYCHNLLGAIYHHRGDTSEARKHFELAFTLLPNCATCCNVGLILFFEKQFKESASYYQLAIEYCGENNHVVWGSWASSLYWVEGDRDRSVELYQKAIELAKRELADEPGSPFLIGCLIEYYAAIRDTTETFRMIAHADSLALDDQEVLYAVGDAYEIFGNRTTALRYLGDAVRRGFPVSEIEATPELEDLVQDPIFQRVIAGGNQSELLSPGSNN
jgi:tetratricopeptide (TPR) repeat protein